LILTALLTIFGHLLAEKIARPQKNVKASFEDGILKLSAPKVTDAAPQQRRIDIQ